MKASIRIVAVVLGGLVFIGCDKKDESSVTTPNGTTTVTTPSAQSMSDKASNAANNAGDAIKNGADKTGQAFSNGVDNMKTGAQNLGDKMSATTMPSMNK